MTSPRRQRRVPLGQSLPAWSEVSGAIPWVWLAGTLFLYAVAGLMLASFPVPYWVWNLALGGVVAQALALAGPKALTRFRWWSANFLALVAIAGTGAISVALAIALNYAGTDNLDEIVPQTAAFEVVRMSLVALVTAALGAIISAETGDRLLLSIFNRLQTTLILAAVCILGLGLGGLLALTTVV
jgi:hypothetical protein